MDLGSAADIGQPLPHANQAKAAPRARQFRDCLVAYPVVSNAYENRVVVPLALHER